MIFLKAKKRVGFTLMELLIVITLVAAIVIGVLLLINPIQQLYKARDTQRKNDLNVLKKSFEAFYNDKGCYPKPSEVCYNAQSAYAPSEAITCTICGNNAASPSFMPYVNKLPCDPESPKKDYLYQVDTITCPKWYRVYSQLNNNSDQAIIDAGCIGSSCGPVPVYNYNYGVTSPNADLEKSVWWNCLNRDATSCQQCLTYDQCLTYTTCQVHNKYYFGPTACCSDNNLCALTDHKCIYDVSPSQCIVCGKSRNDCTLSGKCKIGTVDTCL